MDPYEEEYVAEEAVWKDILGVKPIYWNGDTAKVSASNRDLVENAWKNHVKYQKESSNYSIEIKILNSKLNHINIHPRSPYPRCLYWWHRMFRMNDANPKPGAGEYVSSDLLQFFSLKFAGDFSYGQTMSVYGFMAVRDDIDQLRNYVFNRSRDLSQEITPDSSDLLLIPPSRGISAPYNLMVEYSLKVKRKDCNTSEEDEELVDGCFEFKQSPLCRDRQLQNVRLFGPLGPVDVRFALLKCAVEATIDVKVKRATVGYKLSTVKASTCGYSDKIKLYDNLTAYSPVTDMEDGGSSPMVAVASAVVAVELGCELKLIIEIATGEDECGLGKKQSHELLFPSQKHHSSKASIIMSKMFKVGVKVTWSTMGKHYLPAFPSKWSLLGEKPDGPCSHG